MHKGNFPGGLWLRLCNPNALVLGSFHAWLVNKIPHATSKNPHHDKDQKFCMAQLRPTTAKQIFLNTHFKIYAYICLLFIYMYMYIHCIYTYLLYIYIYIYCIYTYLLNINIYLVKYQYYSAIKVRKFCHL